MARNLWPSEDSIGKRSSIKSATGPFIEVIGVAADGQYMFVSPEHQPYFYLPLAQNYSSFRSLQIRSSVPPESLIPAVQQVIRNVEPDLPLIDVRTMDQVVQGIGGLFIYFSPGGVSGRSHGIPGTSARGCGSLWRSFFFRNPPHRR